MKLAILAGALPVAAGLVLSACDRAETPAELAVVQPADAWCRPTPNGRDVTGCYLTLTASRNDRLVSVSSPLAAEVEIHEMKIQDGIMSMSKLPDGLPLPAGEAVQLKPGADHLMLLGLTSPLAIGETLSLTLTFEHAGPVGVRAEVKQAPIAHGAH